MGISGIDTAAHTSPGSARHFLSGGGEMGALIRSRNWSETPVGPSEEWPQSLRTAIGILLDSGYPMYIAWGPDFTQFYNDAYRPILGSTKHPAALGLSSRQTFPEIWDFIGPMFQRVMNEGQNTTSVDQLLPLNRHGFAEDCYFTFSYSAIRAEGGYVGGVFVTVIETTERVVGERRLRTLRELATDANDVRDTQTAFSQVIATLRNNPLDIPAALLYFVDEPGTHAALKGSHGFTESQLALARELDLDSPETPALALAEALKSGRAGDVADFSQLFGEVHVPTCQEPIRRAVVLPLLRAGQGNPFGLLVAGVSPRHALDGNYRNFLDLVAGQITTALANVMAYDEERKRAEALAELDRAKTTFFSNVSHEFRTPLTLMLGPLEEALSKADALPDETRESLAMAHRNSLRLLKLVNTLLDFSRIEAGRIHASYEPVDICTLTVDLASSFRSAIEKAGLDFRVSCESLPQPVFVDRDMWEKIVLNLISNAFKFTFEGEISVRLRADGGSVQLTVADTGTGIPESEVPRIFQRFHRVEGAKGRTFEGTGIGLALVAELVKLHGGNVTVESAVGAGTTFTISIPFGSSHLPQDKVHMSSGSATTAVPIDGFIEESLRWIPGSGTAVQSSTVAAPVPAGAAGMPRVLIADDNADMREYVQRILAPYYEVSTAADGAEALASALANPPDLVLSDVMMPRMDGIELVRAVRANPATAAVPVVLLSARVGEEALVDGIAAGADDYLQKPFSAKELLARLNSHLAMSRARHRVGELERSLRTEADAERKRWRDLLLQTPAMVAVLRGPEHVFELANPPYLKAVGREPEAVVGKPLREALPEIATQVFRELLDRVYQSGNAYVGTEELAYLDIQGNGVLEKRFFNLAYQPSRDSKGQVDGILVHAVDVTDQVLARNRAQESEQQLRTLAEAIPQLVWSCLPDGNCDYLSQQWVDYTGIPETEQLSLGWIDLVIHPDDRERTRDAWFAALNDLAPYDLEYRIRRHDGVYRWFKTRGTPVRDTQGRTLKWFGTCTDIEDERNAAQEREALLQREQAARSTAELLNRVGPALVSELDAQRLSDRVTDLATELVGAEFGALFHNVKDDAGESYLLYTLSGVSREHFAAFPMPRNTEVFGPTFRGEGVVLSDDIKRDPRYGKNAPYHGTPPGHLPVRSYLAVPVISRSGQVLGGLFFGHSQPAKFTHEHADLVTGIAAQAAIALDNALLFADTQRAQAALQESNDELRRANTDLEQFAFAAAHDLQEPLRMVTTYSELLARRLGQHTDEKTSAYLRYVTTASSRMILLLQDLLAYTETTRQSDLPPAPVDLNIVLEQVLSNLSAALQENGAKVNASKLPFVLGRRSNFVQLFQNLIANALKYRRPEQPPRVLITAEPDGDSCIVRVADNGIGIDPAYHNQIFGVFKRLHGSEIPGTGIGLAICQRVVERAGGRIWVESEAGGGATFCIRLLLPPESVS